MNRTSPKHSRRKWLRWLLWSLLGLFVFLNILAAFHAWSFTHFGPAESRKPHDEVGLSFGDKLKALFTGVRLPRPENRSEPGLPFERVVLSDGEKLEAWMIPADSSKGTVLLFHGYGSCKSGMLQHAGVFHDLGYSTMLVDFPGAGGSEGNSCTIGYCESEDVHRCIKYLQGRGEKNIVLFGSSMGAAAVMKAMSEKQEDVHALILECPFGTLLATVENRFHSMNVPDFPMAEMLVFWGGTLNGFNAFSFNPKEYARKIHQPTLLIWGVKDPKVSASETNAIFESLAGPKRLLKLDSAGHGRYFEHYKKKWTEEVSAHLTEYAK